MIAIIDYDAGNIRSVQKALEYIGEDTLITREHDKILQADKVILPGVGSFGAAIQKLQAYHLIDTIQQIVDKEIPFLGICLGLQLFFEHSEESIGAEGLSILRGEIVKFPENNGYKVPQIGWNSIQIKEGSRLFRGMGEEAYVYFVHSYFLKTAEKECVSATADYGVTFDASVERGNLFACQFHPEKSGEAGLQILKNFASL